MTDTVTTTSAFSLIRRGDRLLMAGRPAVVKALSADTTLTVAWRDAWYWRALWWLQDDWHETKRRWRRLTSYLQLPRAA